MRVLFGMILGALLTVGAAFVYDNWATGSPTSGTATSAAQHRMVNWDVVNQNWRIVRDRAHEAWITLSHKVNG